MEASKIVPWHRYALIAALTKRCRGRCSYFGKTALQQMIYLLQEVYNIDCDYDFSLYPEGLYALQLASDLNFLRHIGAVVVKPISATRSGYDITPGAQADALIERGSYFLDREDVKKALDDLVDNCCGVHSRSLLLYSIIVCVYHDAQRHDKPLTVDEAVDIVHQLKPRFNRQEIYKAVEELQKKKYI